MKIEFTRNGKWVSAIGGDRKISARMWIRGGKDNKPLSIQQKVAELFLFSLGETVFTLTKDEIESRLWDAQKAHNRADWKKQESSQLEWWKAQGYEDFKQISTGDRTLTDIAHNGKQIFIGNARISYTPKAWAKFKRLRNLKEIPGFNCGDVSWGFVYKQAEPKINTKIAVQEKLLTEWANATPKPILKK